MKKILLIGGENIGNAAQLETLLMEAAQKGVSICIHTPGGSFPEEPKKPMVFEAPTPVKSFELHEIARPYTAHETRQQRRARERKAFHHKKKRK